MRKMRLLLTTAMLSLCIGTTALAGTWHDQENGQWKYQKDDGSFATGWISDNGKAYYFDTNGIMLTNTITPDDYYVGNDGSCTRDFNANNESTYQEVLDSYTAKLKAATPILVEEFKSEAKSNTNGLNGLAEINVKKVDVLAQIEVNGVSKMAELWLSTGSGSYDEYSSWADKLYDVYSEQADIIFNVYLNAAS